MPAATAFQIVVAIAGSLVGSLLALAYFRRVRLERPPIGTFNGRDLAVLACFIVLLPVLYVKLSPGVLTAFIVVTFLSALTIALRPLVPTRWTMVGVPALLAVGILQTRSMDDMAGGLQVYWAITNVVVLIAAVGVANLYVQGGLDLRRIAWFTLFLGVYDVVFTRWIPLTPELAVALQGRPLDPSVGFAAGGYNANVGLGDLLVFCMVAAAAYKGFGRRGAITSLGVIVVFGAVAPSVTPLLAPGLFGSTAAAFVPVQTLFGPAAFAAYVWLARTSRERTNRRWVAEQTAPVAAPTRVRPGTAERPALAGRLLPGVAVGALVLVTALATGDTAPSTAAAAPDRDRAAAAAAPSADGVVRVAMRDVRFGPGVVTVRRGQVVEWVNQDRVPHDVVATSGASFSSPQVKVGERFRFRATSPARIAYLCSLHQGMTGSIDVTL